MPPVVHGMDPSHQTGGAASGRSELPDPCGVWFGPKKPVIGSKRVDPEGCSFIGLPKRGHWYPLVDFEHLEVWNNRSGARAAEVVEEIVALPAGPQTAHLDEPRPDGVWWSADSDRSSGDELGVREELVAGEIANYLRRCGPPAEMAASVKGGRQKGRNVMENVSDLDTCVTKAGLRDLLHYLVPGRWVADDICRTERATTAAPTTPKRISSG